MEEDIVLVNKSLQKDAGAFEKLIDRYQKPIYNLGMRMFGNSDWPSYEFGLKPPALAVDS